MGLSVEVVSAFISSLTCSKKLDALADRIQSQRDAIAQREAAKAAKQAGKATG